MDKDSKIMVIGKKAIAVSAITQNLKAQGYSNLVASQITVAEDDTIIPLIKDNKPQYLFFQAGTISYDYKYYAEILEISRFCVEKLLFIADSNIYPSNSHNPIKENQLLSGPFRKCAPYAPSHITGLLSCGQYRERYGVNYLGCICPEIYGIGSDSTPSFVTTIIKIISEAKKENLPEAMIPLNPDEQRDYIFSGDFGDACVYLMNSCDPKKLKSVFVNIGAGQIVSNQVISSLVKRVACYQGKISFQSSEKAEPCHLLDCQVLQNLGWLASWDFINGINVSYEDFIKQVKS